MYDIETVARIREELDGRDVTVVAHSDADGVTSFLQVAKFVPGVKVRRLVVVRKLYVVDWEKVSGAVVLLDVGSNDRDLLGAASALESGDVDVIVHVDHHALSARGARLVEGLSATGRYLALRSDHPTSVQVFTSGLSSGDGAHLLAVAGGIGDMMHVNYPDAFADLFSRLPIYARLAEPPIDFRSISLRPEALVYYTLPGRISSAINALRAGTSADEFKGTLAKLIRRDPEEIPHILRDYEAGYREARSRLASAIEYRGALNPAEIGIAWLGLLTSGISAFVAHAPRIKGGRYAYDLSSVLAGMAVSGGDPDSGTSKYGWQVAVVASSETERLGDRDLRSVSVRVRDPTVVRADDISRAIYSYFFPDDPEVIGGGHPIAGGAAVPASAQLREIAAAVDHAIRTAVVGKGVEPSL